MQGESHWFPPLLVIFGGIGILLISRWMSRTVDYLLRVKRQFTCPALQRQVTGTLLMRKEPSASLVDIERCSGAPIPDRITCDKRCLVALRNS